MTLGVFLDKEKKSILNQNVGNGEKLKINPDLDQIQRSSR